MIETLNLLFDIINFFLISRIILSWFPHNRFHPVIKIIYNFTDPLLTPFRNMINPIGGIDISPVILILLLMFIRNLAFEFFAPSMF